MAQAFSYEQEQLRKKLRRPEVALPFVGGVPNGDMITPEMATAAMAQIPRPPQAGASAAPKPATLEGEMMRNAQAPAAAPAPAPRPSIPDPLAGYGNQQRSQMMLNEKLQAKEAVIRQLQAMGPMQYDTPEKAQLRSQLIAARKQAEMGLPEIAASLRPREITTPEQDAASKQWLYNKLQGVNRDREGGMALPPSPEDFSRLAELPRTPTAAEIANSPEKLASQEATFAYNQRAKEAAGGMRTAWDADRARALQEKEMLRGLQDKQNQVASAGMDSQIAKFQSDTAGNTPEIAAARSMAEIEGIRAAAEKARTSRETAQMEGDIQRKNIQEARYNLENIDPKADEMITNITPTLRGLMKGYAAPGDIPAVEASSMAVRQLMDRVSQMTPEVQSKYRQKIMAALGNPSPDELSTGSETRATILDAFNRVIPTDAKSAYVQGTRQGNEMLTALRNFLYPGR